MNDDRAAAPAGLFAGLTGIAKNALGLVISRIELAALELAEVRGNLLKVLLLAASVVVAACFALACWSTLIIVLAWPVMGWTILVLLGAVFTGIALLLFRRLQAMISDGKLSMPATMNELRNDRDSLL